MLGILKGLFEVIKKNRYIYLSIFLTIYLHIYLSIYLSGYLEWSSLEDPDVRRDPVPELDLHNVPDHQLLRLDGHLLTVPK